MKLPLRTYCVVLCGLVFGLTAQIAVAQEPAARISPSAAAGTVTNPNAANYFDPSVLNIALIVGPPPTSGTREQDAELEEVHRLHDKASPELVKFAQTDAGTQNIFLYATIFGPGFNPQVLPLTAALNARLIHDANVETTILKYYFKHPRPYQMEPEKLKSFCGEDKSFSYPSGHSMFAYLSALVMTSIVPEKSKEIMARADQFAEHRLVCAVHFPSDVRAAKIEALEVYGSMVTNTRFQEDVGAARKEIRGELHLPSIGGVNPPTVAEH